MGRRRWYPEAMNAIERRRELTLIIGNGHALKLYSHLIATSGPGRGAGYRNLFYIVRYRRFHRLLFSATALGLGVSLELTQEGELWVRMNENVGHESSPEGIFIWKDARGPRGAST